jgi:hypothetical protein
LTIPGDPANVSTANNSQIKVCSVMACLNGSITLNIANGLTTDGASASALTFSSE